VSKFTAEAKRIRVMARQYGRFGQAGYTSQHVHAEQQIDKAIEAALTAAHQQGWNEAVETVERKFTAFIRHLLIEANND